MKNTELFLVTSFPKSGATWFRFLIYVCVHGELKRSLPVRKFYPQLIENDLMEQRLAESDRLFVKSHLPYSKDLPLRKKIKTCIYLSRNPMDVLTSKLNHYILEGVKNVETNEGKANFFNKMIEHADAKSFEINKNHAAGGWNNHVNSWIHENNDVPVYNIRYEDMRVDSYEVLRKMNRDLKFGFTDENMRKAADLTSFEKLRALEKHEIDNELPGMFYFKKRMEAYKDKNIQFINKGKVGNFKSVMSADQIAKAINNFSTGMKTVHYHFDNNKNLIF